MKKILNITLFIASILCFYACEIDNYDGPDAHISGQILDHHGNWLRTEPGSSNMRIRMDELSWAKDDPSVAITPTYLNVKIDGTYNNTKIFSGQYRMTPIEGAFYPYDSEGEIVNIKASVSKDFVVTPYLDVDWVVEPHLTEDHFIEASVRFIRNYKDGTAAPDLSNIRLFVSSNQYVGNNNYYSDIIAGAAPVANSQEGDEIILKTSKAVKYANTTCYVRAGVCCSDEYKKYNYTTIVKIYIP